MKKKKSDQKIHIDKPKEHKIKSVKHLFLFLKKNNKTLLLFCLAILLVYVNIFGGEFVTADDPSSIEYMNKHTLMDSIKSFHPEHIYMSSIQAIFGINASAFHIASVLFHMVNTILAFSLVYLITENKKLSTLSTLIFAIHPVCSEAVAWLSGRAYMFQFFFGALTLIAYILYRKSENKEYLATATLIFIISSLTWRNPWILVIPFFIVGIDQLLLRKKLDIKQYKSYLPFLISSLIYGTSVLLRRYATRVETLEAKYRYDPVSTTPLINRIPYTIFMAVKQLVWPIDLSIYHEGQIITKTLYTFMIIVTLAVFFAIFYLWKKDRTISSLMILILVSILPTFSPVIVAWFIADRYLYWASLLFGLMIVRTLMKIEKTHKIADLTITVVILLLLFYGIRTALRTNDFKTNKNLWLATKRTAPFSRRVYNNLGDVYSKEQNWPLAVENFKRSVEISPNYAEAIHNLGFTYMQMGDLENAKKYLTISYQKNPTIFQALYKLGLIAHHEGDLKLALEYMNKALEVVPDDPQIQAAANQIQQEINQGGTIQQPTSQNSTPIQSP